MRHDVRGEEHEPGAGAVQRGVDRAQNDLFEQETRRRKRRREPGANFHHPLFPVDNDAPPRKAPFVWIHLSRLRPDETVENHPQRWPAGQLKTWQDIFDIAGGGLYRIWATDDRGHYTAFYPANPSDFYDLPGPPKPFFWEERRNVVRRQQQGSVSPQPQPTEAVSAPPPKPTCSSRDSLPPYRRWSRSNLHPHPHHKLRCRRRRRSSCSSG